MLRSVIMSDGQVTQLLLDWRNGRKDALDQLTPLVYGELRKMASSYLATESQAETLQPTALVHEAYIRMVGQSVSNIESRSHFFGIASRMMRQILVEHARKQLAQKRGARPSKHALDEALTFAVERSAEVVALDDALAALAQFDERKARAIELRYFGGLDLQEMATVMELSLSTVGRELRMAEAWLHREMTPKS